MTNRFAVVGNPINHSLSPIIHQHFAKQAGKLVIYEKIQGDDSHFEQQVSSFFADKGKGLNITLPFKTRAFAMASHVTPRCKKAKAANTLWMQDGQLHADNTDGVGLIRDLEHYVALSDKSVLLLGAGGAARGVVGPLLDLNITNLTVVNRTMEKAQTLLHDFPKINCAHLDELNSLFDIIINATSISLTENKLMLPNFLMNQRPFCYDLAYNVEQPTPFVATALQQGCVAVDGLGMLVEQAAEAFYIWHGFMPETQTVLNYLRP